MQPIILLVSRISCASKIEFVGWPTDVGLPQHLWTVIEAAHFLRVHPETLREWVRGRKISYIRLGAQDVRFRSEDIQEFLQSRLNVRRSAVK